MNPELLEELIGVVSGELASPSVVVLGDGLDRELDGLPAFDQITQVAAAELLAGDGSSVELAGDSHTVVILADDTSPALLDEAMRIATDAVIVLFDTAGAANGRSAAIGGALSSNSAATSFGLSAAAVRPWLSAVHTRAAATDLDQRDRDAAFALADGYAALTMRATASEPTAIGVCFPGPPPDCIPRPTAEDLDPGSEPDLATALLGGEVRRLSGRLDAQLALTDRLRAREVRREAQLNDLALRLGESLIELSEVRGRRDHLRAQLDGYRDSLLGGFAVRIWRIKASLGRARTAAGARLLAPIRRRQGRD